MIAGLEMDPSTKPSLFLADNEMIIDRFHEVKAIPVKGAETRIELGLSEDPMKYGLRFVREGELDSLDSELRSAMEN